MQKLETMFEAQKNFVMDRPTVIENNNNPDKAAGQLLGEVQELIEAISLFALDKVPIKEIGQELADVMNYLLNLCLIFDVDIFAEVMEKIAYNNFRYPASAFQDGDYKTSYLRQKDVVVFDGMKKDFYDNNA